MGLVSSQELADYLKVDRRRIEQLVADEGMPRASRGKYDFDACVKWYVDWAQKRMRGERPAGSNGNGNGRAKGGAAESSWWQDKARLMRAEADMKELELARERGELIPIEDAARLWDEAFEKIRAKMMGAIGKHASKVVGLRNVKQANAALEKIVHAALAAGAGVIVGDADGDGDDDSS